MNRAMELIIGWLRLSLAANSAQSLQILFKEGNRCTFIAILSGYSKKTQDKDTDVRQFLLLQLSKI